MRNRYRYSLRRFQLGTEGGSMLEYIMLVGILALAAIYGFRQARARESHAIAQQAKIIRTLDPSAASDPQWTDPEWGDDWTQPVCNEHGACTVPGQCFAAGTLVATESGLVPIETIREGDLVWSRDEKSGDVALRSVVKRFVTAAQAVIDLNIAAVDGGETIRATNGHPFWVTGRGWVPAADLAANEALWSPSGEPLHVAQVATAAAVRLETVYNFEIADYHTFFVGHHGLWVHNGGPGGGTTNLPPCQKPPPKVPNRCPEEFDGLYSEMKSYCDAKRSCNDQKTDCAGATEAVAAGYGCVDSRTNIQKKCFQKSDTGYQEHMQQIAEAYQALRKCEAIMKAKCP